MSAGQRLPEIVEDEAAEALATCFGRVGLLEFGPFELATFAGLMAEHSLPGELELRVDGTSIWWSWVAIQAAADPQARATDGLGPLGNWFTRVGNSIVGPTDVAVVTRQLDSGELPPTVQIQVGDGPWQPVVRLLVVPDPATPGTSSGAAAEPTTEESAVAGAAAVAPPSDVTSADADSVSASLVTQSEDVPAPKPALAAALVSGTNKVDSQRLELEAWLAKTMPDRQVAVTVAPKLPSPTFDSILASAAAQLATEADAAARGLSPPWIWGTLALFVAISGVAIWLQPTGPDDLELLAVKKVRDVWDAIQAVRAAQVSEDEWQTFCQDVEREVSLLKLNLELEKSHQTPVKELLFWALEYRLPTILKDGRLKPTSADPGFVANLSHAEQNLAEMQDRARGQR